MQGFWPLRSANPRPVGGLGIALVSLLGELGDMAKRVGVGLAEVSWVDGIGPGIDGYRASTDVDR